MNAGHGSPSWRLRWGLRPFDCSNRKRQLDRERRRTVFGRRAPLESMKRETCCGQVKFDACGSSGSNDVMGLRRRLVGPRPARSESHRRGEARKGDGALLGSRGFCQPPVRTKSASARVPHHIPGRRRICVKLPRGLRCLTSIRTQDLTPPPKCRKLPRP